MFWNKKIGNEKEPLTDNTNEHTAGENRIANKLNRREMLKLGTIGAFAGTLTALEAPKKAAAKAVDDGIKNAIVTQHNNFPHEINKDYKPHRQHDTVHAHSFFNLDKHWGTIGRKYIETLNYGYDNSKPGFTQLDKALVGGAWALSNSGVGPSPGGVPDFGLFSWEQADDKKPFELFNLNFVKKEKYQFQSKAEAAAAIKRAATLYGANLVGITRRDKRWDYSEFFNPVAAMKGENPYYGWEKFPFEPKTVIVLAFEMDYEAISASPFDVAEAGAAEGYSRMAKTAHQLAVFFKALGYNAVPAGNDMGLSVPYAIAAGLGEGSRIGTLVTYKYGPRVRIAKVYTNFDFTEYDKPKSFGVFEFCSRCKRCADACPGKAISFDDAPSFAPTHDNKDNPWFNAVGIKKWYLNSPKCYKYWCDNDSSCGNCIATCPYNKPNFWHHRLVDKLNRLMPGPVHTFMKQMDIAFGYGNTFDKKVLKTFWDKRGRSYDGF
jgi:reductive dehalogenase